MRRELAERPIGWLLILAGTAWIAYVWSRPGHDLRFGLACWSLFALVIWCAGR
jgi:4-hydroxybenzoate polyprenyltransferase